MKKIAIVGTSPASKMDAPYADDSWEIWTLGHNLTTIPRFDLFFEVHFYQSMIDSRIDPKYLEDLKKIQDKLILGHRWEGYEDAKLFPTEEIKAEFGTYLNSSVAIMIAYAIHSGAETIGLWGVDMAADSSEYGWQKGCCEYLLGLARGRGIEVIIAKNSPLLRGTRIYGLESDQLSAELCDRRFELQQAIGKLDQELNERSKKRKAYQGALDVVNDLIKRWG